MQRFLFGLLGRYLSSPCPEDVIGWDEGPGEPSGVVPPR